MINLLPPDHAASIRYGRQNTMLLRWLAGAAVAIAVLAIIIGVGWVYMNQEGKDLQRGIDATNQQLKNQNFAKVQADAKEITGDINVIDKVLSQEIHFSDLIQTIGSYMPAGASLSTLSLSSKVEGALDMTVNTLDYPSAAQVAVNLGDPSKQLFSKVDIISINCAASTDKAYKCVAVYRVLFDKAAQTKFLGLPSESDQ